MQVQFPKKSVKALRCILSKVQACEESQQLRIPEPMADVGRILGTWGQILLRTKEWREGHIMVSGGTMVWVMYLPEGESEIPQTVQAWLPFQMKWDIPYTQTDGKIRVLPLLENVDARSTSARKMVVRASVSVQAEAYLEEECNLFSPEEVPSDLCLLEKTYPMLLTRECGEKIFEMEEDLTLPTSAAGISEIIRFSFHPELIDQKVLSGKVVFRGSGLLHVLYRSEDGELCTWDFEIPFAQYDQLDMEYEQEARCRVLPVVTGLELDHRSGGELRLKAGISGQYMIYDITQVKVAEDAYRIHGDMKSTLQELSVPSVLDIKQQTVPVEHRLPLSASQVLDTAFYPGSTRCRNQGDNIVVELSGTFYVVYEDENDRLQGKTHRWQGEYTLPAASNVHLYSDIQASRTPRANATSGEVVLRSNIYLDTASEVENQLPMITAVELGEKRTPDPERPGLILQRIGNDTLWELAKENGTTVERIQAANHLVDAPEPGQMLLIPIL